MSQDTVPSGVSHTFSLCLSRSHTFEKRASQQERRNIMSKTGDQGNSGESPRQACGRGPLSPWPFQDQENTADH